MIGPNRATIGILQQIASARVADPEVEGETFDDGGETPVLRCQGGLGLRAQLGLTVKIDRSGGERSEIREIVALLLVRSRRTPNTHRAPETAPPSGTPTAKSSPGDRPGSISNAPRPITRPQNAASGSWFSGRGRPCFMEEFAAGDQSDHGERSIKEAAGQARRADCVGLAGFVLAPIRLRRRMHHRHWFSRAHCPPREAIRSCAVLSLSPTLVVEFVVFFCRYSWIRSGS